MMLFSGEPLPRIESEATEFFKIAVAQKQATALSLLIPALRLFHSLMGKDDDIVDFEHDAAQAQDAVAVGMDHFIVTMRSYVLTTMKLPRKPHGAWRWSFVRLSCIPSCLAFSSFIACPFLQ